MEDKQLIKMHEIWFRGPHQEGEPARAAEAFARWLPGVIAARRRGPLCLEVEYDLSGICLKAIRQALQASGFHLDAALLEKLKCALVDYTEQNQREALGLDGCNLPPQKYRPTGEAGAVRERHVEDQGDRSDDPWRHYL
ncbi:hypothetical protein LV475_00080 [Guyparkeria hydrothermalis]|uniref:hypothetical protein n=1 Tax=Guyparkeria hydrothermalis TaxID=923 RepID=UPI0020219CA5|nr:hypothetical protein [Guyparkeria hydrothermalis]MCL7750006.1 hypothetical protein [Guyparkeria hydrothermalis]